MSLPHSFALSALALACITTCQAQTSASERIIVTATRQAQNAADVLADVSVIDRADIERAGNASVADLIAKLPGVSLSRNGGPAATTNVYLRGAEGRFTAVLIDGVRVDSQATGGATWNAIPLSQVERIEVLRGPAAVWYGSDAVAGVVQIFTRQGQAGIEHSVKIAAGTYGTKEVTAGLRGAQGMVNYSLNIGHEESRGFNAVKDANPDKDGYRNQSLSLNLGLKLNADHELRLTALDAKQKAAFDGYLPNQNDESLHHLRTIGLNWQGKLSKEWTSKVSLTSGSDRYESVPDPYVTKTDITALLWQNQVRTSLGQWNVDVEQREDRLQNDYTLSPKSKHTQASGLLGYSLMLKEQQLSLSLRHDRDNEFGNHTTGQAALGSTLAPGLKASLSAGTAFRVPTLFQRFSIYGTSDLKAETARTIEAALRYQQSTLNASLTLYRNTVDNLINYVNGPGKCVNGSGDWAGCYVNTGHARMQGASLVNKVGIGPVNLTASYDYLDAQNTDNGKALARRPKSQAKLGVEGSVNFLTAGVEAQYVGQRFDDVANTVKLPAHTLVNLYAQAKFAKDWRLLARVDNLANTAYESVAGYYSAGRTFYLSLAWAK